MTKISTVPVQHRCPTFIKGDSTPFSQFLTMNLVSLSNSIFKVSISSSLCPKKFWCSTTMACTGTQPVMSACLSCERRAWATMGWDGHRPAGSRTSFGASTLCSPICSTSRTPWTSKLQSTFNVTLLGSGLKSETGSTNTPGGDLVTADAAHTSSDNTYSDTPPLLQGISP